MAVPSTNVPLPSFVTAGFNAPSEAQILAGVIEDFQSAFAGALNLDPANSESLTTPQGQLATSLTAILGAVNSLFLFYVSQVDPAFAMGRMQDGIARIYFITRELAKATIIQCQCVGLPGVAIPIGALVTDGADNTFSCDAGGEIGADGTAVLPFSCLIAGPVAVPVDVDIYQSVPGWDSVSVISGVIGANTETRSQFEGRRSQSVAINSRGWLPSIVGAVLAIPDVIDCFAIENATNAPETVGGISLPANSIYVAVTGGDAQAIAQAIWTRKAPGCSYYPGNTTVTVYDQNPDYVPPYPAYAVTFEIPADLPIVMLVTMANNVLVPSNAQNLVQQAVVAAFAGEDGGARQKIGGTVFASRFYAGIQALWAGAQIVSILVGSANADACEFTGSIAGSVLNVTAVASGVLAAGQTIKDAAGLIAPSTQIMSFGSGSGGLGSYNLSISQTISSEAMLAINPTLYEVPVNINQIATIFATDVTLALI
jgi:hypothetical protein